jgi:RND family efflux transporter MFP subunit
MPVKSNVSLLVCLAALLVGACSSESAGPGPGARPRNTQPPAVEAVEVRYGTLPLEERLVGAVRARNQTEIYAEVAAPIVAVLVNDGDRVAAGDVLVRLRATDFEERVRQAQAGLRVAEARVAQAEANLTRFRANLERMNMIAERGLGTAAELDAARADALTAEADIELMRAQRSQAASLVVERETELAQTIVRAPIDGVVGGRNAEVGQQADTSTPLFVIGDTGAMRVNVTLTQNMLGYITPGTSVNVYSEAEPDRSIRAQIARISPFLHPVAHTTEAEIDIDGHDGQLRPGMFVTVDVLYGESERAALVPNSALYRHPRDGREGVFVTHLADMQGPSEGGYSIREPSLDPVGPVPVQFMPVEIIARGRMATAIGGVQAADWVVTLGHHLLANTDDAQAIVQPTPWDHILGLQQMQSQDLLDIIERKQAESSGRVPRPN